MTFAPQRTEPAPRVMWNYVNARGVIGRRLRILYELMSDFYNNRMTGFICRTSDIDVLSHRSASRTTAECNL